MSTPAWYESLKAYINRHIRPNNRKEITGQRMNTALNGIVDSLKVGIEDKVGKPQGTPTTGNIAEFGSDGNIRDSHRNATQFATAEQGAKADTAVQHVIVGNTQTADPDMNASVANTGTQTEPVLEFTIPRGKDAVNPFKGWFGSPLELPPSPRVGDFAHVNGATDEDPVKIYECATAGVWTNSGREVDTSNVSTFSDGTPVNSLGIANGIEAPVPTVLDAKLAKASSLRDAHIVALSHSNAPLLLEPGAINSQTGANSSWKPAGVECCARTIQYIHAPFCIEYDSDFMIRSVLKYTEDNGKYTFVAKDSYSSTARKITIQDTSYVYRLVIGKAKASDSIYVLDTEFDMEAYSYVDSIITKYLLPNAFKMPIVSGNDNVLEELYLTDLDPTKYYMITSLGWRNNNTAIGLSVRESSDGVSYNTVCSSVNIVNGEVSSIPERTTKTGAYITWNSGISGYCVVNLPVGVTSYADFKIDPKYCSNINNFPKIKKYIESHKVQPSVEYKDIGNTFRKDDDNLVRMFVKTKPMYAPFYFSLYPNYYIRRMSLYKDGQEIQVNNAVINAIQNSTDDTERSPSYKAFNHYGSQNLKYHKEYGMVFHVMKGNGTNDNGTWDEEEQKWTTLPTANTISPDANILREFCDMSTMVRVQPKKKNADAAYKRMFDMITTIWKTPEGKYAYTNIGDESTFRSGERLFGMPYSSVKEYNKFIGQEVSYRTVMSALANPASVMYTEYVANDTEPYGLSAYGIKYTGSNCGAYYGSVCSATTAYILGIPVPLRAAMFYYDVLRELMYNDFPCKRIRGDFESKWKWYNASSDSYLYTDRKGVVKNLGLANDQIDWEGNNYVIKDYDTSVTPYTLTVEIDGANVQYVLDETIPSGEGGYQRILDYIEPFDIMVKSSHCTTITNIWKDEDGKVQFVEVSEMTKGLPKTTIYRYNEFASRYGDGHILVRYQGDLSPETEDTSYYRRQDLFDLDEPMDVLTEAEFKVGFHAGDYATFVRCTDGTVDEYDTTTGDPIFVIAKAGVSDTLVIDRLAEGVYEYAGSIDISELEPDDDGLVAIDLTHSEVMTPGLYRVHLGTDTTYAYCEVVGLDFSCTELQGGGVKVDEVDATADLFAVYLKAYGGASLYGFGVEDDGGDPDDEGGEPTPSLVVNPYRMVTDAEKLTGEITIPEWNITALYNGIPEGQPHDIFVKLMVKGQYGTVGKAIKLR